MSEYLSNELIFTGRNSKVKIAKPIHLAKTIGPPPKAAILPSVLAERDNPIEESKAKKQKIKLDGCVMASEAFFPFRDNVDLAKKIGVKSIIQPGGSIKDDEIISITDQHKISMVFTATRVFKH